MSESSFAVADVGEFQVETPPYDITIGMSPETMGELRPDLNGFRVKVPGLNGIYLIHEGRRRLIPNPETYNNLFRDWEGILEGSWVKLILEGSPIANGAVLARGIGTSGVYLIDLYVKRGVASPETMERYHFNWDRVYPVPVILLDNIPSGTLIRWPQVS